MKKKTLSLHKRATKLLSEVPAFNLSKRGKLPKPLHQIGGPRIHMTQLIPVAEKYCVWFMWKDGVTLEQTSFYAYLFHTVGESNLYPLCHFHWHPSHKPLHIKTPCGSDLNYTNRNLPSSNELNLSRHNKRFDPRIEQHRLELIEVFCQACGIQFGHKTLL